jgi:hypothetical protein
VTTLAAPPLKCTITCRFDVVRGLPRIVANRVASGDSVGLRRAMLRCAVMDITEADFSDWDSKDMKGRIANACPKCDRLFRDLAKATCQNCGHVFEADRLATQSQ